MNVSRAIIKGGHARVFKDLSHFFRLAFDSYLFQDPEGIIMHFFQKSTIFKVHLHYLKLNCNTQPIVCEVHIL